MIPAEKEALVDWVLYRLLLWSLKRSFFSIHASGMDHLRHLDPGRPTLACANHTNWWDGLVVFYLTRFQPQKSFYCMMEEKQLRHYRFFSKLGAFSVDLDNHLRSAATIRYTLELLKHGRTLVWMFPQGTLASPHERIVVRPGLDFLAKRAPHAQVLPAAFRYEYRRESRPEIFLRFAPPILAHESSAERLREVLQSLADELEQDCRLGHLETYERILTPRLSINKRWERARLLLTGRLGELRSFQKEN